MKFSSAFIPTLREVPADAQVASHIYLLRGGFMRRLAAGVYNFLPLGLRVISKIEAIVREEMDRAGAQEVLMPASIPAELWQETGRWQKYGPELLRFKDRKGAEFCFGPTHEEVITDMVRREVKSYRDLPLNLYQIQGKFRDEMRPRAGLMRGREFIMKDAYSFDTTKEGALAAYDRMYEAYKRIFTRCGLAFRPVEADTGAIGGSRSHEFQVLAESGEDNIVACDNCEYAANVEQAEMAALSSKTESGEVQAMQEVATPKASTIQDVAAFLKLPATSFIKTLVYVVNEGYVLVCVRGDHSVNEIKLRKFLGVPEVHLANEKQVWEATKAPVGFAGPQGATVRILADVTLKGGNGLVAGANKKDMHVTGVDMTRDVASAEFTELRLAEPGDLCARCKTGHYKGYKGIEVGHVFYLGTVYSKPMNCAFLDESGQSTIMEMGCYGIGITRVAAAAIEQNHDKGGIIWPLSIAPYEVELVSLQNDEAVMQTSQELYDALQAKGVEVLWDNRSERPGAKFADADLLGIPLRLAVGARSLKEGNVELKWRKDEKPTLIPVAETVKILTDLINQEKNRLRGIS